MESVVGEGASLLSNPKLLDDRARFNLIDAAPGIVRIDAGDSGGSTRWNCICPRGQNGAPLYVRVGEGGAIQTSPTGAAGTWTTRESGVSTTLNFVLWAHNKFWVVGQSGVMLTSSDGVTWTPVSLPSEVATDNLTCIATNGTGTFVVSNGTAPAALLSVDAGASWSTMGSEVEITHASTSVHFDGTYWILGRNTSSGFTFRWQADPPTGTWGTPNELIPNPPSGPFSITDDGVNRIASYQNGQIAISPMSGPPNIWTLVPSGTTASLRVFVANGRVYAVGQNGECRVSTDNGATWTAGPSTGVSTFLRFGVADPHNPTRAIIVGDSGVTLFGQYPFYLICYESDTDRTNREPELGKVQEAYADMPKRVVVPNLLEIDVEYFTP